MTMTAITKDTVVVGAQTPRISPERFVEILMDNDSPAAQDGFDMYAVAVANRVDPAFLLAFFKHESQFGKVGVCHDYDTHSPGNTRTSRIGVPTFVTVPGKGQYVKYDSWAAGANDATYRLSDPSIEYHWGYPIGHDIAPHFSTNISDAWRIVEKITNMPSGDPIALKQVDGLPAGTRFYYWFKEAELPAMNAQEAATEICLLALKALGIEVRE